MSLVARTGARSQTFTFGALGTTVTLQVVAPPDTGRAALALARAAIDGVATACSRTADSPLGTANAAPDAWHVVPPQLYLALERAARAHELTGALFDPRLPPAGAPAHVGPWRPAFDADRLAVRLGAPVDLGGIGTGIAVDLASAALSGVGDVHLVDAGRGRRFSGHGPDGDGWRVALEDPAGATGRLAVLRGDDRAVATSSKPAREDGGLLAATVLDRETTTAQAWSSALLVAGAGDVRELATAHDLAAIWVDDERCLHLTPDAAAHVVWLAPELDVRDSA